MAYVPDPTDITRPTDADIAESAQAEFRALKAYIAGLVGGGVAGMDIFRKNAIIGGSADTNPWQRGSSFAAIASGEYSADRWKFSYVSTGTFNIDKPAGGPTVAQCGGLVAAYFRITCVAADAVVAAADFIEWGQSVEGYNFLPLAQRPIAFSFWHAHSKIGTYCVALRNSGADRSLVTEYTQAVANAWEKATVAIPASPAAGTWDYGNGIGLTVNFSLMCGATFQTATTDAWQIGNFFATANQVNGADSNANIFRFARIQLEPGTTATEFEHRSVQQELLLCQRYFWKTFPQATAPAQNNGINTGELQVRANVAGAAADLSAAIPFPAVMRAAPTIVTFNPAAANAQVRNISRTQDSTLTSFSNVTDRGLGRMLWTGSAGQLAGDLVGLHVTASAEL